MDHGFMGREIPANIGENARFVSTEMRLGRSVFFQNGVDIFAPDIRHMNRSGRSATPNQPRWTNPVQQHVLHFARRVRKQFRKPSHQPADLLRRLKKQRLVTASSSQPSLSERRFAGVDKRFA